MQRKIKIFKSYKEYIQNIIINYFWIWKVTEIKKLRIRAKKKPNKNKIMKNNLKFNSEINIWNNQTVKIH